jgi:hypothetical protein
MRSAFHVWPTGDDAADALSKVSERTCRPNAAGLTRRTLDQDLRTGLEQDAEDVAGQAGVARRERQSVEDVNDPDAGAGELGQLDGFVETRVGGRAAVERDENALVHGRSSVAMTAPTVLANVCPAFATAQIGTPPGPARRPSSGRKIRARSC